MFSEKQENKGQETCFGAPAALKATSGFRVIKNKFYPNYQIIVKGKILKFQKSYTACTLVR